MAPDSWAEMPFSKAVATNPSCKLAKGAFYPFVEMQALAPFTRQIREIALREYTSGGSKFRPGDTLMARITPCLENGKIAQYRSQKLTNVAHGSTEFIVMRGVEGITDTDFVFYLASSRHVRQYAISHMTGTSGRQRVPTDVFGHLQILVPPLPEQRAIAAILGALDDKIELNRRMNETLEAMARALFQSWFVGFDPVRAKMEGRQPAGMDAETAALFPDAFEDSTLGPMPLGWAISKIADLCTTQYGFTASAVNEAVGPHLLRITDMNKQPWIEWGSVPYCVIDPKTYERYKLQAGDVLVSRMADPGKAAIVEQEVPSVFASYLIRLKAQSLAESYFLFYFLRSDRYLDYSRGAMAGSVQANMNAKVITAAEAPIPPQPVTGTFLEAIKPLRQQITANLQQIDTLTSIRDALLPKLLSGEIRVGAAEEIVEAAV